MRSLFYEINEKNELKYSRSSNKDYPVNSPTVNKRKEKSYSHCTNSEKNLNKYWIFLSFCISDDLSEEEKANINCRITSASAKKKTNSNHINISAYRNNNSTKSTYSPRNYHGGFSSKIIWEKRYDNIADKCSKIRTTTDEIDDSWFITEIVIFCSEWSETFIFFSDEVIPLLLW